MNYEVKEKKFFELLGIQKVVKFDYKLKHLETTFDLEKYELEMNIIYKDSGNNNLEKTINFPVEFNTSMTEQLNAKLEDVMVNVIDGKGIDVSFNFIIEIEEIEQNEIIEEKQEIKENYQLELEEKLSERNEEEPKFEVMTNEEDATFMNLKTDFVKFRVINLEEGNLDKISSKYNLKMDYLFNLKKSNNKLIVYDKE